MLWQEDDEPQEFVVPDDIVDLCFNIDCKQIALDHAQDLSNALHDALDWLAEEQQAGVHLIHGASTGNGWQRPENTDGDAFIYLSRRARMHLRVPRERIEDTQSLTGMTLQVGDYSVKIGKSQVKPLSALGTLFARYIPLEPGETEEIFLERTINDMRKLDIRVRKVLCGTGDTFNMANGPVNTLSVMVADLEPKESVILQQQGIGPGRKHGFGLFIPHKGIKAVGDMSESGTFSGA